MNRYQQLAIELEKIGIGCHMQHERLMVVSAVNPAMPTSNCFWVTERNGNWYIGTWLPSGYLVPREKDLVTICQKVIYSSKTALYQIEPLLASELGLTRLNLEEMKTLDLA